MSRWRSLLLTIATVLVAMAPMTAIAYTWPGTVAGRGQFIGYFQGAFDNCGDSVLFNGLGYNRASNKYTAGYGLSQFVTQIHNAVFSGTDGQDRTGAAFLILTMIGVKGTDARIGNSHNNGVNLARSLYPNWLNLVTYYDSIGKVEWNRLMTFPFDGTKTYLNSLYQGRDDCGGGLQADGTPRDDTFYVDDTPQTHPTIIFHNPDGSRYMIKRNCANPVGPFSPLTADYNVTLSADDNGSGPNVTVGSTYSLRAVLHNNGSGPSLPGNLEVMMPAADVARCACAPEQTALTGGLSSGSGYRAASAAGIPAGANWYWTTKTLPNGTTTSATMRWKVSPTAKVGDVITFHVYYYQANDDSSVPAALKSATVTFKVVSEQYPSVVGVNGDIHAGGGIGTDCVGMRGSVTGYSKATSYGEYVVSSSAITTSINNFGSTGTADSVSAATAALLKLGKAGNYLAMCRPDLVQAAADYRASTLGYATTGAATFDVTGKQGVYYLDSGVTTVSGSVTGRLTLVGKTIRITSSIINTAPATADSHNLPSMGIITSGDIDIDNAATRVDAYLFANGVIDTCTEGASSNTTCLNTLSVNGFLMAADLSLHRLGPKAVVGSSGAGKPVLGEQVNLTPQIYLNPPTLFDSSVDDLLLDGQGQRQPLF